jgi:hypothetical protein
MPSQPREFQVVYEPRPVRDPSQPREFQVVREPGGLRDQLAADRDWQAPASAYRLKQAEDLLREMGYVPQDDGTWQLPDR